MKKNRRLFLILSVFTQIFSFAGAITMLFRKNRSAAGGLAVIGGTAAVVTAALIGSGTKKKKSSCQKSAAETAQSSEKTDREIVFDTENEIAFADVPEQNNDDTDRMLDAAIDILKNASGPLDDADAELESELNNIE